jgi:hypothetical protein
MRGCLGASVGGLSGGVNENGTAGAESGEMALPREVPKVGRWPGSEKCRGRGGGAGAKDGDVSRGRVSVHAAERHVGAGDGSRCGWGAELAFWRASFIVEVYEAIYYIENTHSSCRGSGRWRLYGACRKVRLATLQHDSITITKPQALISDYINPPINDEQFPLADPHGGYFHIPSHFVVRS